MNLYPLHYDHGKLKAWLPSKNSAHSRIRILWFVCFDRWLCYDLCGAGTSTSFTKSDTFLTLSSCVFSNSSAFFVSYSFVSGNSQQNGGPGTWPAAECGLGWGKRLSLSQKIWCIHITVSRGVQYITCVSIIVSTAVLQQSAHVALQIDLPILCKASSYAVIRYLHFQSIDNCSCHMHSSVRFLFPFCTTVHQSTRPLSNTLILFLMADVTAALTSL